MRDTLVDAFVDHSSDGGSSPPASTKQPKTKILSNLSLGNVKAGAFAVLRVEIVLSDDVPALSDKPGLWTGFPTKNAHQARFSLSAAFFSFSFGLLHLSPKAVLSTNLVLFATIPRSLDWSSERYPAGVDLGTLEPGLTCRASGGMMSQNGGGCLFATRTREKELQ